MAIITDENTFFNFVQFLTWKGQYSGSTGTQNFDAAFTSQGQYVPTAQLITSSPTVGTPLTHGFNTYFKMQGFNSSTNSYEVWFSTTAPLLIPPSGHALSNIEIVQTWIDR